MLLIVRANGSESELGCSKAVEQKRRALGSAALGLAQPDAKSKNRSIGRTRSISRWPRRSIR